MQWFQCKKGPWKLKSIVELRRMLGRAKWFEFSLTWRPRSRVIAFTKREPKIEKQKMGDLHILHREKVATLSKGQRGGDVVHTLSMRKDQWKLFRSGTEAYTSQDHLRVQPKTESLYIVTSWSYRAFTYALENCKVASHVLWNNETS